MGRKRDLSIGDLCSNGHTIVGDNVVFKMIKDKAGVSHRTVQCKLCTYRYVKKVKKESLKWGQAVKLSELPIDAYDSPDGLMPVSMIAELQGTTTVYINALLRSALGKIRHRGMLDEFKDLINKGERGDPVLNLKYEVDI